jgi:hypothetical protein
LTQIKWDKAKDAIAWVIRHIQEDIPMERTKFRSKSGFLGHATDTYNLGAPYMQGFYLSENSWCDDRDLEGYRLPKAQTHDGDKREDDDSDDDSDANFLDASDKLLFKFCELDNDQADEDGARHASLRQGLASATSGIRGEPPTVVPVPRLLSDALALQQIFKGNVPAQVIL